MDVSDDTAQRLPRQPVAFDELTRERLGYVVRTLPDLQSLYLCRVDMGRDVPLARFRSRAEAQRFAIRLARWARVLRDTGREEAT